MSYKKTVIRKYFQEYLKTLATYFNQNVFCGNINPRMKNISYPFIQIISENDNVVENLTDHTMREMDLMIHVTVKNNDVDGTEDFMESVELAMFNVEQYMSLMLDVPYGYIPTNEDNFNLFESVRLERSLNDSNIDSSSDIGTAVLSYKVEYNYENPVKPQTFEDFDIQGSIENMTILYKGEPIYDNASTN